MCKHKIFIAILTLTIFSTYIPVSSAQFSLDEIQAALNQLEHVPNQLLVRFQQGVDAKQITTINRQYRVQIIDILSNAKRDKKTYVLELPQTLSLARAIRLYEQNPLVEYAIPNLICRSDGIVDEPNDERYSEQWNYPKIDLPKAWAIQKGSSTVIVAVLDSGIDFEHPDLQSVTVQGYDFANGDKNPADDGTVA